MKLRHLPLATLVLAAPSTALAHISLEQGGTHASRYGDGEIKDAPCGRIGGTRGENVYTYTPGETITVSLSEYIPHPGYFRFAFDDDGDDDFVDPVSIKPVDSSRPCPFDEFDQCGTTDDFQDLYNTPAVLPGMDYLEPHVTAAFGEMYTFEVTLPNVQCDNCTLQVIQVMEDVIHGGYNTDRSIEPNYIEDVYHQCIDLVLEGPLDPSGAGGAGSGGAASMDEPTSGSGGDDSGCSTTAHAPARGSGSAAFVALVLGALALRRRRQ